MTMPNEHAPIGAAEIAELRRLEQRATRGPWRWWISNSWRRLKRDDMGISQPVAEPYVCRDGHPDISISEADMELIATLRNRAPALLTLAERGLATGAGETDEETARQVADRIVNRFLDLGMMTVVPQMERNLVRDRIAAALATARASERERCAKIAEMRDEIGAQIWPDGHDIAAAIREDKKEGA